MSHSFYYRASGDRHSSDVAGMQVHHHHPPPPHSNPQANHYPHRSSNPPPLPRSMPHVPRFGASHEQPAPAPSSNSTHRHRERSNRDENSAPDRRKHHRPKTAFNMQHMLRASDSMEESKEIEQRNQHVQNNLPTHYEEEEEEDGEEDEEGMEEAAAEEDSTIANGDDSAGIKLNDIPPQAAFAAPSRVQIHTHRVPRELEVKDEEMLPAESLADLWKRMKEVANDRLDIQEKKIHIQKQIALLRKQQLEAQSPLPLIHPSHESHEVEQIRLQAEFVQFRCQLCEEGSAHSSQVASLKNEIDRNIRNAKASSMNGKLPGQRLTPCQWLRSQLHVLSLLEDAYNKFVGKAQANVAKEEEETDREFWETHEWAGLISECQHTRTEWHEWKARALAKRKEKTIDSETEKALKMKDELTRSFKEAHQRGSQLYEQKRNVEAAGSEADKKITELLSGLDAKIRECDDRIQLMQSEEEELRRLESSERVPSISADANRDKEEIKSLDDDEDDFLSTPLPETPNSHSKQTSSSHKLKSNHSSSSGRSPLNRPRKRASVNKIPSSSSSSKRAKTTSLLSPNDSEKVSPQARRPETELLKKAIVPPAGTERSGPKQQFIESNFFGRSRVMKDRGEYDPIDLPDYLTVEGTDEVEKEEEEEEEGKEREAEDERVSPSTINSKPAARKKKSNTARDSDRAVNDRPGSELEACFTYTIPANKWNRAVNSEGLRRK